MTEESEQPFGPSPDRTSALPMEEHHRVVEEAVNKLGGRIKHCFRNAFEHLRRAWTLHPVDSPMALFRAITAEEEAATALILALKQRGYDGAEKLNPRDHTHKAAISPFLDAVQNMLAGSNILPPKLSISTGESPKIMLSLDLTATTADGEELFAHVDQPFNYMVRLNGNKTAHLFNGELSEIANRKGHDSILSFVKAEANLRNKLLYASDEGIPDVRFNEGVLLKRRDRVYRLALITIGILQTTQKQLFATQCVLAYRTAIGHIADDLIDYDSAYGNEGFFTTIIQQPDGKYNTTMGYRMSFTIPITYSFLQEIRIKFPQ